MTREVFFKFFNSTARELFDTCQKKNSEYGKSIDVFANFHSAAKYLDSTREFALYSFMVKHIVSLSDAIHTNDFVSYEYMREKIGDIIVYSFLLLAMMRDKFDDELSGSKKEA